MIGIPPQFPQCSQDQQAPSTNPQCTCHGIPTTHNSLPPLNPSTNIPLARPNIPLARPNFNAPFQLSAARRRRTKRNKLNPQPQNTLAAHRNLLQNGTLLGNARFRYQLNLHFQHHLTTHNTRHFSLKNTPRPSHPSHPSISAKLKHYHKTLHTHLTLRPPKTKTPKHLIQKTKTDWQIFQDLEQKYRDIYGEAPRLQNGDYFAEKGEQRRQLRAFEWVTKMTVAPSRCGKMLAIYRMQGHPLIPDLRGGEEVRREYEALEGDVKRDVTALVFQLKGMLVRA